MEIWRRITPAANGNQVLELNAHQQGGIFQDIQTIPGEDLIISFSHKGRIRNETVALEAGEPGGPFTILNVYTNSPDKWQRYTVTYKVPRGQKRTRIRILSRNTGSLGNLIDHVVAAQSVNAKGELTHSDDQTIAFGDAAQLWAKATHPTAEHFNWSDPDGNVWKGSSIEVKPLRTTDYTIRVEDACGASISSGTITVTVNTELPDNLDEKYNKEYDAFEEFRKLPFDSTHFRPKNLVFVLDVFSSMNDPGKFDLLVSSMEQLISMLRPEDRISFMTFNYQVNLLADRLRVDEANRDQLLTILRSLKAVGSTDGEKAIEAAFHHAGTHGMDAENNQVIMVTDAMFGFDKGHLTGIMEQYLEKDLKLSVLAISPLERDLEIMQFLANICHGRLMKMYEPRTAGHCCTTSC